MSPEPVDVVLTDIFMPHTDGIELIHALRRQSPDFPIVAMSGGGYDDGKDVLLPWHDCSAPPRSSRSR